MPGKNLEKIYVSDSFYHVYSRGVNKQVVFRDEDDYKVFLNLFKRYLSNQPAKDNKNREYPWFAQDIQLLAFCLMPNHFHCLVYQTSPQAMTDLFRCIITTYGMYFNKKYKRVGPLFQSRFRANRINREDYLDHISRYIHLNPKEYKIWPYSSYEYYLGRKSSEWLHPQKILELFEGYNYAEFVSDYEDNKASLEELKNELSHL